MIRCVLTQVGRNITKIKLYVKEFLSQAKNKSQVRCYENIVVYLLSVKAILVILNLSSSIVSYRISFCMQLFTTLIDVGIPILNMETFVKNLEMGIQTWGGFPTGSRPITSQMRFLCHISSKIHQQQERTYQTNIQHYPDQTKVNLFNDLVILLRFAGKIFI